MAQAERVSASEEWRLCAAAVKWISAVECPLMGRERPVRFFGRKADISETYTEPNTSLIKLVSPRTTTVAVAGSIHAHSHA